MPDIVLGSVPFHSRAQARMRATRLLFDYWRAESNDKPFRRLDIDPSRITDVLPFIILGDIEADPFRVRFRLVGTGVVEFSRLDFSGKYLDELSYSARDSVDWQACYRQVHGERIPIIGNNEIRFVSGRVEVYEFAILPLARDTDPAGSFIACEAYEDFDRLNIPDLTPVERRD